MRLEVAERVLRRFPLCDWCLGRLFAIGSPGRERSEVGRELKDALLEEAVRRGDAGLLKALARSGDEGAASELERRGMKAERQRCALCGDRVREEVLEALARRAAELASGYEYETFLVGTYVPPHVRRVEEHLIAEFGLGEAESLRRDVTRRLRRALADLTGKRPVLANPELSVLVDPFTG
ncbi:MAG: hypothetical protein NZ733_01045, partial [Aigarchaeota archaeon]|nr:hypothetical protein [Aigarchaeota archaeon]